MNNVAFCNSRVGNRAVTILPYFGWRLLLLLFLLLPNWKIVICYTYLPITLIYRNKT